MSFSEFALCFLLLYNRSTIRLTNRHTFFTTRKSKKGCFLKFPLHPIEFGDIPQEKVQGNHWKRYQNWPRHSSKYISPESGDILFCLEQRQLKLFHQLDRRILGTFRRTVGHQGYWILTRKGAIPPERCRYLEWPQIMRWWQPECIKRNREWVNCRMQAKVKRKHWKWLSKWTFPWWVKTSKAWSKKLSVINQATWTSKHTANSHSCSRLEILG